MYLPVLSYQEFISSKLNDTILSVADISEPPSIELPGVY